MRTICTARRFRPSLLCFVGLVSLASYAQSQATLRTYNGLENEGHFASSVAALGDVDGDGVGDYAIGAAGYLVAAKTRVYSGRTGGVLYEAQDAPYSGTRVFSLGDIDGDGIGDFSSIFWDYDPWFGPAYVNIFSGVDGARMFALISEGIGTELDPDRFGTSMCGVGDVNGDGIGDVAITNPDPVNKLYVYSGADGQLLWSVQGDPLPAFGGFGELVPVGDRNADGVPDLAVLYRAFQPSGGGAYEYVGGVRILSGSTGATLSTTLGTPARSIQSLLPLGADYDGDGLEDFVLSGVLQNSGTYIAISSILDLSGSLVQRGVSSDGIIRPCGRDLTGDGVVDVIEIISQSTTANLQAVQVRSGVDLHPVYNTPGIDVGVQGVKVGAVAAIDDINQDGQGELLLGSYETLSHTGEARIVSGGLPIGSSYCHSAAINSTGHFAEIYAVGSTSVADQWLSLRVEGLPPGQFAFFLASMQGGFVAHPGGSSGHLCLGGSIGRFNVPNQIQMSNSAGTLGTQIDLNNIPQASGPVTVQAGQNWRFQLWYRDNGGTSNFSTAVSTDWN